MSISTVEEKEIPEYFGVFTLVRTTAPNEGAGIVEICAAGHHPKCRIIRAEVVPFVYASAADVIDVQNGDGTTLLTGDMTASATVFTKTAGVVLTGEAGIIERNEAILMDIETQGSATNVTQLVATFESVH